MFRLPVAHAGAFRDAGLSTSTPAAELPTMSTLREKGGW